MIGRRVTFVAAKLSDAKGKLSWPGLPFKLAKELQQ